MLSTYTSKICSTIIVLLLCGCAASSIDPAHPEHTANWVDTRLYFGLGPADQPAVGVSEATWRSFLDQEVTSRFPDGLSVLDVYGQWQGPHETVPERLHSKMLVIDYPNTAQNQAKIEAIRTAWKHRTGDLSVLRVTQAAEISF
ncbi:MAG: DUF3574 domain-containing protein [Janthinobacterium lividum]